MAQKIEIYPTRTKKKKKKKPYRWRCVAGNGQPIATGHQNFANKANAQRAALNAARVMARIWRMPTIVDMEKEKKNKK